MSAISAPVLSGPTPLGAPSLDNQSAAEWQAHRELAYVFARHVRHDLVNVQCSLQLIEVVEKMRELGGDLDLPPELQPDQVKIKVRQAIKQIASMCNDLVLLSQATTEAAYRGAHSLSVAELMETAVGSRLGEQGALPVGLSEGPAGRAHVVAMGDMLHAAVAACCFQWTPWLFSPADPVCAASILDQAVLLSFPVLDRAMAARYVQKLPLLSGPSVHPVLQEALTTPTSELALWLARFIVALHGGSLSVAAGAAGDFLLIHLPLTR
jgi:hypothetical protein